MQLAIEQPIARDEWARAEDAFRVHAFNVYYKQSFREERHPLKRFVKALLASTQPIQDRDAVIQWYREHCRKHAPSE